MKNLRRHNHRSLVEFADQSQTHDDEFVIPEDLSTLSDNDLNQLYTDASELFNSVFGDGTGLSNDDMTTLSTLTEGVEAIAAEQERRNEEQEERDARAAELASRVRPADADTADTETDEVEEEDDEDDDDKDEDEDEEAGKGKDGETSTTASAAAVRRVNLSRINRKSLPRQVEEKAVSPLRAASDFAGYGTGTELSMLDMAKIVDKRLVGYNGAQFSAANAAGKVIRQQMGVATITKNIPAELMINGKDDMDSVLSRAVDEHRLKGGSLVAAGGWCAPSETIYDLLELESRDGLFSLPEVGIARGGISRTLGPDFADLFKDITKTVGFHYTEAQDISGNDYPKPCVRVDCPDFEEFRLEVIGLCIQAGLLQQRGYPEVIARSIRGLLVAQAHHLAAKSLGSIKAGSTAVTMPASQAGVTAPVLSTIELHAEHMRYARRLARNSTIEAIFPFWLRGAIRADLSRRNGVDLLSVTDAQITAWFSARQISPQFVYNWQDINSTNVAALTAWPTTVEFLMYPAGTWIRGTSDIITVDTLYDSSLLADNDYTALFTEEGWLVLKMGHDSRAITTSICPDGTTAAGVDFECNGTVAAG